MGSEAEALNERFDGEEINDPKSIHFMPDCCDMALAHLDYKARYKVAKQAKVGETITCPTCSKRFKKKSYQQAFCSNKGKGNCKDRFHNTSPERLERTLKFC